MIRIFEKILFSRAEISGETTKRTAGKNLK